MTILHQIHLPVRQAYRYVIRVHRVGHDRHQHTDNAAEHVGERPPGKVWKVIIAHLGNDGADEGDEEGELHKTRSAKQINIKFLACEDVRQQLTRLPARKGRR